MSDSACAPNSNPAAENQNKKLFVVGTGTDVGKTYVTALMLKKLRESGKNAAYFKAAMSGNDRREDRSLIPGDALTVKTVSGIRQPLEEMCPYLYENAYAPHLASRIEGNPVRMETVRSCFEAVCRRYDFVTMEGTGGILCPIRFDGEEIWLEDVIRQLGLSSVVVADAGLGTINHTVLTIQYMRSKNLPIAGVIFNRFHPGNVVEEDNLRMCEHRTGLKVLARVQDGAETLELDALTLTSLYQTHAGKSGERS